MIVLQFKQKNKKELTMTKEQVGTIVGSSVHLTGAIKDSSDITIFGSVDGEVSSEQKVIIEEPAYIKGPITASEVIVSGRVVGTINAKNRLELNPTGAIKGNIDTGELLIHSGATFIGECTMPDKATLSEKEEDQTYNAEVESEPQADKTDDADEESIFGTDVDDEDEDDKKKKK
jgi:cytoskeletal protein CcmA (bactofilin family)